MRSFIVFFLSLAALISALFGRVSADNICFIGHRGYSSRHVDNTTESFEKAGEKGFGGAETDVRVTKDGVFVLSHNSEIVLKDGSEMIVADHTYEELTAQPLRNTYTRTELYICTFKEYLEILKSHDMFCFIELKGSWTDEQISDMFNMADEVYGLEHCSLQSFDMANLDKAHAAFPTLNIMLTCSEHDALVDEALEKGYDIDMEYSNLTTETVQMFHDKGLKVACWTANTKAAVAYCASLGVDYIESDVYSSLF